MMMASQATMDHHLFGESGDAVAGEEEHPGPGMGVDPIDSAHLDLPLSL
jgi:hypothetical protein